MTNDKDWIERLRKEEECFLPEPPEGLWNEIKSNLPSTPKQSRIVPLWLRYCGVAACVALVFGVGIRLLRTPNEVKQVSKRVAVESHTDQEIKTNEQPQTTTIWKAIIGTVMEKTQLAQIDNIATDTTEQQSVVPETPTQKENAPTKKGSQERKSRKSTPYLAYNETPSRNRQGVSFSLFGGNLLASNSSVSNGYNILADASNDAMEGDNTYEDIDVLTQGNVTDTKKRYRLPLRAGVRVSIPVAERLAVESGVTYTLLSSTVESGSTETYYSTEQKLHYIGVPVKLRYKIWQGKRAGVYVSGGGMIEKCVSGKSQTNFYIGGDKHSDTRQTVREKQLQLSASLTAGVEANIAKGVSMFVEPGVSYYIDNHSGVDNTYKDKPLNIDLNIGIRLNINR